LSRSRGCILSEYSYVSLSFGPNPHKICFFPHVHSEFHDNSKCQNFASTYLGYYPSTTYTQFDDEVGQDDDGNFDDVQACCLPSELAENCPYPTCGSEGDGDGGGSPPPAPMAVRNQQSPAVGLNAATQSAEAFVSNAPSADGATATARPPLWWQSTAGRRAVHLQSRQAKQAKQATQASLSKESKQTTLGENPITSYTREYSLTQQRNDACYFDEKYQLWVKTSCHGKLILLYLRIFSLYFPSDAHCLTFSRLIFAGKRNELVHTLFADEQCTLAMKKSVHALNGAVNQYGYCVSNYSYTRSRLVVCRNEDGVAYPYGNGGVAS